MKGRNKLVLASAIAAISAGANAELKALDDSAMGELTGQAGLTIDIETKYTIGEFAYKDAGSILFQGISMGGGALSGGAGSMLDNIRLSLDVAGSGAVDSVTGEIDNVLHYGFSEITELATMLKARGNTHTGIDSLAANTMGDVGEANLNTKKTFGDGDLVIHIDATDHLKAGGGMETFVAGLGLPLSCILCGIVVTPSGIGLSLEELDLATFAEFAHHAVDFNFSIDAIKLASSDYVIGSGALDANSNGIDDDEVATQVTTLISDLNIRGLLGPTDIQIENNGNGFDGGTTGNADSKIHWDTYIDVTDLDVYIDIAGVKIENMKINNTRGDVTNINGNNSFGFAHSERTIYAVKDTVLHIGSENVGTNPDDYVDGIAINTIFKGDMEIGALKFGDTGTSIGRLYWTDIASTTNWTISAH